MQKQLKVRKRIRYISWQQITCNKNILTWYYISWQQIKRSNDLFMEVRRLSLYVTPSFISTTIPLEDFFIQLLAQTHFSSILLCIVLKSTTIYFTQFVQKQLSNSYKIHHFTINFEYNKPVRITRCTKIIEDPI